MKYDNTKIEDAVKSSNSWAGVYRLLTNAPEGKSSPGMQNLFKKRAVKAGIDFSHFKFQQKAKVVPVEVPITPIAA